VRSSTEALASGYDRILLELSGGLDSSIIAASLARTTAHVTAVNLVTPTAEGDERRYARQVASQAGFDLVELPAAPEIDMTAPPSARLVRPSGLPGVLRAWEDRFADEARRRDVQAFFGGTGGDNVFCALGSAAPAADALRSHGPGSAFFHAVRDVAGIHGSTFWSVLLMAWHQARRPPPDPPWPRSLLFTNEDAMPRLPQFHPWLDEPAGAPPGSRSHVRSIMAAQAHLDGYARHAVAPSAFPLLSQPVMEACLQIPSWLWVQGAIDRAVARAAFRDHLPAAVAARRTKGMMNAYCTRVYEQNRPALRTLLLDGRLAAAGLIDRTTLGRYLDTDAPVCDILFYRVLELADVEVWARSWLDD
jgi:asparagine synthase (glutamine-hydrolysing)